MRRRHLALASLAALTGLLGAPRGSAGPANRYPALAQRTFRFAYRAVVKEIPSQARDVRVWIPLPATDPNQTIASIRIDAPAPVEITRETQYGNSILFLRLTNPKRSEIPIALEVAVTRRENAGLAEPLETGMRQRLLSADKLVPIDGKIRDLALRVTRGKRSEMEKARAIYEHVTATMRYDKTGEGWGRGDAVYACDVGKGNCTDFHALIIGLARAVGIPARFSIGFPLPEKRGEGEVSGYHCWAELYVDGRWLPVDSSEAAKNPAKKEYFFGHHDANRIQFTTGRDLQLRPAPAVGALNYMVYPVVEVDGEPHAVVERRFSFADLEGTRPGGELLGARASRPYARGSGPGARNLRARHRDGNR